MADERRKVLVSVYAYRTSPASATVTREAEPIMLEVDAPSFEAAYYVAANLAYHGAACVAAVISRHGVVEHSFNRSLDEVRKIPASGDVKAIGLPGLLVVRG